MTRRLPVGAEVVSKTRGTGFRVWAPRRKRVEVLLGESRIPLEREDDGYFSAVVESARAGAHYRFSLDGGAPLPDPASRFQPEGPHGPSEVVDPSRFEWSDGDWRGISDTGQVIYEMHVGTFTRAGTFAAAADELAEVAGLGVTTVELMPVAEFPGRFGWGYDGVDLFAPYHVYGSPDDLRAFVDRAHAEGLGVILDVVYNHFGPDGNYLREYSQSYFSAKHATEWGDAINFDDHDSRFVREFVLSNVRHWIAEYHFDGLRLDATHAIVDDSPRHILEDIGLAATEAAGSRGVIIVAETEPQDARIVRAREAGGYGLSHIWCDDFHHSVHVACTGRREAYFTDYRGTPQEFVSSVKHNVLYQGQHYRWQKQRRGWPATDVPRHRCVFYLENHDQVANSRYGLRLHELTSPARYRAFSALLLLAPQTPMLFQGQEFGASSPFLYFADHNPELNALVRKGRAEFMAQFASMRNPEERENVPDPGSPETFERSRLDLSEREEHAEHYRLYHDLIVLRRCDPVLAPGTARVDGAVLSDDAFVLRFIAADGDDRLLVVNLGSDLELDVVPEPLLAPPAPDRDTGWRRLWHSEDACYGGIGAAPLESDNGTWRIPAESATLLASGI